MSATALLSAPHLMLSQGLGATLQPGQARTLRVPTAGALRVTQGALWVTRRSVRAHPVPADVYVAPGQPLALCAGESVVIEPIHQDGTPASQVVPAAFDWQPCAGRCASALRWLGSRLGARRAPLRMSA